MRATEGMVRESPRNRADARVGELDALRAFHELFKDDQQALFDFFGLLAIERYNAVALCGLEL